MPPDDSVLHILCVHGFRQSGKQFKGRLQALQKRLRGVARLTFMDAPFQLPHFTSVGQQQQCQPRRAWLVSQQLLDLQRQLEQGQGNSPPEAACTDAQCTKLSHAHESTCSKLCKADPVEGVPDATAVVPPWGAPVHHPAWVDPAQLHQQTIGWGEAITAIQQHMATHGPFDGLLGFSQGAAVAAGVAAVLAQQRHTSLEVASTVCESMPGHILPPAPPAAEAAAGLLGVDDALQSDNGCHGASRRQPPHHGGHVQGCPGPKNPMPHAPRFVVLCSGYIPGCPEASQVLQPQLPVAIPSCHVYSVSGADQQVPPALSLQLAGCFAAGERVVVEHDAGHLMPSSRLVVQQIKDFLGQFQCSNQLQ